MVSPTQYANEPREPARAGDIGARIQELREELARLAGQVQEYVGDRAADLRDSAVETTGDVEEFIRENPLPAVGLALGVGLILGIMVRGRGAAQRQAPTLSRRDLDRLAYRVGEALESAAPRLRAANAGDTGDWALLERLAAALTGLIDSSRSTAASVGSAGGKAVRTVAAVGERTARSIADRLAGAVH